MSEHKAERAQVNNLPVKAQSYWINRLFCWHRSRYLRVLLASNGAEVYCGRCHRKRFGYVVSPPGATS